MKTNHNTNIKLYKIEENIENNKTFTTTGRKPSSWWNPASWNRPTTTTTTTPTSVSAGFRPDIPDAPPPPRPNNVPNTPNTPNTPDGPNTPNTPDGPNTPNTPDGPDGPDGPNTPNTPDGPDGPDGPDRPDGPSPSREGQSLDNTDVSSEIRSVEATMETNPSFTDRVGRRFNSAANVVRRHQVIAAIIAVAAVIGLNALINQLDEDMCNKCCLSTNIKTQLDANTPPSEAEADGCIKPNGWPTFLHPMPYTGSTKISLFEEGDMIVFEADNFKILRNDNELSNDIINKLLDLDGMELNKDMFYNYIVYNLSVPANDVDGADSPIKYQIKGTITEEEANDDNINLIEKDEFITRWESAIESASNEKMPVTGTYVTVGPDEIELFEIYIPIENINRDTVMLDENNSIILKVLSPSKILPPEELPNMSPPEYCSNKCINKFKKFVDTIGRAGQVAVELPDAGLGVAIAAAEIASNAANAAADADLNKLGNLNPLNMLSGLGSDIKNMLIIGVVIFFIIVIIKNKK